MHEKLDWEERYKAGDLPWDTGRAESELVKVIAGYQMAPCKTLEIGCGTGTNAMWLAEQGFDVTATDISPTAIEAAINKADAADLKVTFKTNNILAESLPGGPFDLVFDRGCFHSIYEADDKTVFASKVSDLLSENGLWLSLIGSTDGPDREIGPPRLSAAEITSTVEPLFEIIALKSIHFDSDQEDPPRAWSCLMRKRVN